MASNQGSSNSDAPKPFDPYESVRRQAEAQQKRAEEGTGDRIVSHPTGLAGMFEAVLITWDDGDDDGDDDDEEEPKSQDDKKPVVDPPNVAFRFPQIHGQPQPHLWTNPPRNTYEKTQRQHDSGTIFYPALTPAEKAYRQKFSKFLANSRVGSGKFKEQCNAGQQKFKEAYENALDPRVREGLEHEWMILMSIAWDMYIGEKNAEKDKRTEQMMALHEWTAKNDEKKSKGKEAKKPGGGRGGGSAGAA